VYFRKSSPTFLRNTLAPSSGSKRRPSSQTEARNVDKFLPDYTASHPRKPGSPCWYEVLMAVTTESTCFLLVGCLAYTWTLKLEIICSSETDYRRQYSSQSPQWVPQISLHIPIAFQPGISQCLNLPHTVLNYTDVSFGLLPYSATARLGTNDVALMPYSRNRKVVSLIYGRYTGYPDSRFIGHQPSEQMQWEYNH
jgi:hypothetical protein